MVFLKISQNSQENTCARVFFVYCRGHLANLLKKGLSHRCFSVNFAKFLRTPTLSNISGQLLLLQGFCGYPRNSNFSCLFENLLLGLFRTVRHKKYSEKDVYVDGGFLCNYPIHAFDGKSVQKQPPKGVLSKRCSENMQQIYMRTTMPTCDFNKVASNFIEVTLRHGCYLVNLLHIFRAPFYKNAYGGAASVINKKSFVMSINDVLGIVYSFLKKN